MRIGILKADSVLPHLSHFGQYTDMFPDILRQAEDGAEDGLEFVSYDVEHGVYPDSPDECDGYLITGSRHSVYDPLPWIPPLEDFVRELDARRTKLIAVCFGHQLVARALGGRTEPATRGWTVGVQEARLSEPYPWASPGANATRLIHSHKDQVTELPRGAELVGGNDACPVGFYRIGSHVMSVQAHPEFSPEYARALYDTRRETFGDELYREALDSLEGGTSRLEFARWMARFYRTP